MSTAPTTVRRVEDALPVLLSYKQAAALLGCGERTLFSWQRAGFCPRPKKIGPGQKASAKFHRDELLDWAAAGCPPVDAAKPNTEE